MKSKLCSAIFITVGFVRPITAMPTPTPIIQDIVAQDSPAALRLTAVPLEARGAMSEDRIIDVAVDHKGLISVLLPRRILQFQGTELVREFPGAWFIGSPSPSDAFIAAGPAEKLYIFYPRDQRVVIIDAEGVVEVEAVIPFRIVPSHSFFVDSSGFIYIGGYSQEYPDGQVHQLCPDIACYIRSFGGMRPTRHREAERFFQGGFVGVSTDTVYYAGLNPYLLARYAAGTFDTLGIDGVLPDGEEAAFTYDESSRQTSITNRFARTTGFVRRRDGGFAYSAFVPEQSGSLIRLLGSGGRIQVEAVVPGAFDFKGELPNGNLVALRMYGRQQVAIYAVEGLTGR